MEVNGEEERLSRREDEGEEGYYFLLNTPCSAFHRAVEAILQCLGLDSSSSSITPSSSSSSSEELARTEIVEETGIMGMVARLVRRRRRQPYSSGAPGQHN